MVKEAGGWIKRNVAAVVTWAIILLGGAVAWGSIAATIATTGRQVEELTAQGRQATTERFQAGAEIAVIKVRQEIMGQSMVAVVQAVDRLESVVSRLEALASRNVNPGVRP